MVSLSAFVTTRSGLPSLFTSPTATEEALNPKEMPGPGRKAGTARSSSASSSGRKFARGRRAPWNLRNRRPDQSRQLLDSMKASRPENRVAHFLPDGGSPTPARRSKERDNSQIALESLK